MSPKPAGILYTPQGQKTYRYDGCTLSVVGKPSFPNDRARVVQCGTRKGLFVWLKKEQGRTERLTRSPTDQKPNNKNGSDGPVNNFLRSFVNFIDKPKLIYYTKFRKIRKGEIIQNG